MSAVEAVVTPLDRQDDPLQIPCGFKWTSVGIIPETWRESLLGDLATVSAGGTPSRSNSRYWNGDIPWITTAQIDYSTILEADESITRLGLLNSAANLLPPKTLLLALYGQGKTRGKVAILGIEAATNQACAAIQVNDGTSTNFVFHSLVWKYDEIRASSNLGSQENLTGALVREIRLPVPPLPEQRAIATALSDVDNLIAALDALIAKKRAIKQAAMQQLLTGKTRLPRFEGEWETKRIGAFTDCTAGGTPNTEVSAYWNGTIRWMNSGELHAKRVHEVAGRITEAGLRNSSTKIVPPHCVLVGLAGQGKTRGTVAINMVPLCTNQSIAAIFPNPSFDTSYLFYNLENRYEELRDLSTGDGGRGGLNLSIIRSIEVPIPSKAEQQAIAQVLSDMDAEIEALQARVAKTRDIKQGMMQQLLTGRIRLVAPTQLAEESPL